MAKFSKMMKYLERYLGATYSNICQPDIMTKTSATLLNPEMLKIIPITGVKLLKTDVEMTYPDNKSIGDAIHQKLSKEDVYEADMYNIYNLIVGQKNEQLQEKAASDTTFQAVKADQDPIGYLIILKKLYF